MFFVANNAKPTVSTTQNDIKQDKKTKKEQKRPKIIEKAQKLFGRTEKSHINKSEPFDNSKIEEENRKIGTPGNQAKFGMDKEKEIVPQEKESIVLLTDRTEFSDFTQKTESESKSGSAGTQSTQQKTQNKQRIQRHIESDRIGTQDTQQKTRESKTEITQDTRTLWQTCDFTNCWKETTRL